MNQFSQQLICTIEENHTLCLAPISRIRQNRETTYYHLLSEKSVILEDTKKYDKT